MVAARGATILAWPYNAPGLYHEHCHEVHRQIAAQTGAVAYLDLATRCSRFPLPEISTRPLGVA